MQCAGKMHIDEKAQSIEIGLLEMPFLDAHPKEPTAITLRRFRVEIAGAPVGTGAILDPFAFKSPILLCHDGLLRIVLINGAMFCDARDAAGWLRK
jgi:hypothetical protein